MCGSPRCGSARAARGRGWCFGRREIAGQHLIEMVVAIDQPGQEDLAGQIEHHVSGPRQLLGRPDLLDEAVAREQPGIPSSRRSPSIVTRTSAFLASIVGIRSPQAACAWINRADEACRLVT